MSTFAETRDMQRTAVRSLTWETWRAQCGLVVALIPHIKWRHSNLGMLQGYVHEGSEKELRVHIWHKSLRKPGIEESGIYHDHRFDLNSVVLVGEIIQEEIDIEPRDGGPWMLYEVLHARAAADANRGASFHAGPAPLPGEYVKTSREIRVTEGQTYDHLKAEFHGTFFRADLAVTLCTKTRQQDFRARILAPRDVPLVHAFEDTLPKERWVVALEQAQTELYNRWRREG